jgi:hypothetical protein
VVEPAVGPAVPAAAVELVVEPVAVAAPVAEVAEPVAAVAVRAGVVAPAALVVEVAVPAAAAVAVAPAVALAAQAAAPVGREAEVEARWIFCRLKFATASFARDFAARERALAVGVAPAVWFPRAFSRLISYAMPFAALERVVEAAAPDRALVPVRAAAELAWFPRAFSRLISYATPFVAPEQVVEAAAADRALAAVVERAAAPEAALAEQAAWFPLASFRLKSYATPFVALEQVEEAAAAAREYGLTDRDAT